MDGSNNVYFTNNVTDVNEAPVLDTTTAILRKPDVQIGLHGMIQIMTIMRALIPILFLIMQSTRG